MSDTLKEKIKSSLANGKLPCAVALKIAEELDITPRTIREVADELGVKISSCQLGCFP